jgi:hypothetical protein
MAREVSSSSLRAVILAKHAQEEQQSTYYDGAIGDVERRPVMGANVEIQKICDLAVSETVPEIAYGPAQNQRERESAGVEDATVFP